LKDTKFTNALAMGSKVLCARSIALMIVVSLAIVSANDTSKGCDRAADDKSVQERLIALSQSLDSTGALSRLINDYIQAAAAKSATSPAPTETSSASPMSTTTEAPKPNNVPHVKVVLQLSPDPAGANQTEQLIANANLNGPDMTSTTTTSTTTTTTPAPATTSAPTETTSTTAAPAETIPEPSATSAKPATEPVAAAPAAAPTPSTSAAVVEPNKVSTAPVVPARLRRSVTEAPGPVKEAPTAITSARPASSSVQPALVEAPAKASEPSTTSPAAVEATTAAPTAAPNTATTTQTTAAPSSTTTATTTTTSAPATSASTTAATSTTAQPVELSPADVASIDASNSSSTDNEPTTIEIIISSSPESNATTPKAAEMTANATSAAPTAVPTASSTATTESASSTTTTTTAAPTPTSTTSTTTTLATSTTTTVAATTAAAATPTTADIWAAVTPAAPVDTTTPAPTPAPAPAPSTSVVTEPGMVSEDMREIVRAETQNDEPKLASHPTTIVATDMEQAVPSHTSDGSKLPLTTVAASTIDVTTVLFDDKPLQQVNNNNNKAVHSVTLQANVYNNGIRDKTTTTSEHKDDNMRQQPNNDHATSTLVGNTRLTSTITTLRTLSTNSITTQNSNNVFINFIGDTTPLPRHPPATMNTAEDEFVNSDRMEPEDLATCVVKSANSNIEGRINMWQASMRRGPVHIHARLQGLLMTIDRDIINDAPVTPMRLTKRESFQAPVEKESLGALPVDANTMSMSSQRHSYRHEVWVHAGTGGQLCENVGDKLFLLSEIRSDARNGELDAEIIAPHVSLNGPSNIVNRYIVIYSPKLPGSSNSSPDHIGCCFVQSVDKLVFNEQDSPSDIQPIPESVLITSPQSSTRNSTDITN
ncbi:hypothetical protein GZH46_00681, partial [Fragariocoptes setiger]